VSTSGKLSRRSFIAGTFALAGTAMSIPLDTRARPGAPGRVIVGADRDIRLLDPAYRTGSVEGNVLRAIYRRLIRFKPESLDYELDAAAEIRQVDPTRIEFSLRPGLRFPEPYGEMRAEDVRYSLERFLARDATGGVSPYARDWAALERIEVKGRYAGVIHLRRPAPALWRIALADSSGCILSRSAVEKLGDDFVRLPHGGGPYRIRRWTPNQELVLESNPEYEGAPAPLSEVVIRPIQEAKTGELALRAGELDFTALDPTVARKLEGASGTRVLRRDSLNYVWVGINVEKPPYTDLRVRQAIRKAIDVDAVLLAAYDGLAAPARAVLAPGLLGYWKDAPLHARDIAGARQLLTEAGLEPGFGAKLTLLNKPAYKTAAQVVQANLAEVGIRVQLDVHEAGTFWSLGKGRTGRDLELALQRFGGKTDPSFQTQWFVSDQVGLWNWQRWRSPEFDRLDETASATLDPDERSRLYVRMQKLMEESAAFVWLTHEANVFGARTWLQPAILPTGDDWQYWRFRSAAL
jgi:peptide/nickel transport system substrate-binding protein